MFAHFALTVFALTCLQYIGFVNAQRVPQVCHPDSNGQDFNFGSDHIAHYCNCKVLRIVGNSSVGEACSSSGMTTYLHLNSMPICCPDPYVAEEYGEDSKGRPMVDCVLKGDCWRGSQCDTCSSGAINGVPVCCANCQSGGLNLGADLHCSCMN